VAQLPIGWILAALLASVYVLWAGGVAWVRSRGSILTVSNALVADTELDGFRLPVMNTGDQSMLANATLEWIEVDGHPDHAATTPLPLRWFPNADAPVLAWRERGNVDVVAVRDWGHANARLEFLGQGFIPHVLLHSAQANLRTIVFCVRLVVSGTRKHSVRVFTFVADAEHPLNLRPVRVNEREPGWRSALSRLRRFAPWAA
jgi:hypothetical protein